MTIAPYNYELPCPLCGQMSPLVQELSELTLREFQVLELVIEGKSNKEIARSLDIASGTVKIYVKGLLNKFRVNNRVKVAIRGSYLIKELNDKQSKQTKGLFEE